LSYFEFLPLLPPVFALDVCRLRRERHVHDAVLKRPASRRRNPQAWTPAPRRWSAPTERPVIIFLLSREEFHTKERGCPIVVAYLAYLVRKSAQNAKFVRYQWRFRRTTTAEWFSHESRKNSKREVLAGWTGRDRSRWAMKNENMRLCWPDLFKQILHSGTRIADFGD